MRAVPRAAAWLAAVVVAASGSCLAAGSNDLEHIEAIRKRDNVNEAVDRGLAYLVSQQDPVQGNFAGPMPNTYTALSCMALMAAGHFPGRSRYGESLRRGILYLTRAGKKDAKGYFGHEGSARMYGHGICTLALCEAYGMLQNETENRQIKEAIERALSVILGAQVQTAGPHHGGWRYGPTPSDADLSVAAWQILALRSAQNSQLDVPDLAISNALGYVRRCFVPNAGFAYQPGAGASVPMRSAGVVCMQALGANKTDADKDMVAKSASVLHSFDPGGGGHFYYQSYYVATAANMASDELRELFLPRLEKVLMGLQEPSGAFSKHQGHAGGVYSTAFAVICLCVGYQYLPIYQE